MAKLSKEHIVTIRVLNERGESKCSIARTLGAIPVPDRPTVLGRPSGTSNVVAHKLFRAS